MYMHTIVWWCSPMNCDVYLMLMMHTHTEMMMMYILWWGCIPYDNDAYLWWWCMPYVQWKNSIITCSVIVYDEVYNDVHEHYVAVKWLISILWWTIVMSSNYEQQRWAAVMRSCDEQQGWSAVMSGLNRDWWAMLTSREMSRDWCGEQRLVVQQSHMIACKKNLALWGLESSNLS